MDDLLEKIRRWDAVPRLVCFCMAVLLWNYVINDEDPYVDKEYMVPVVEINRPENMEVLGLQKKVDVRVKGRRKSIDQDTASKITATVDLDKLEAGSHTVLINAQFPGGEVMEVHPRTINIVLDVTKEKIFPVSVKTTGTAATDAEVAKTVLTPAEVKLKGASTRIDAVKKVEAPIDIEGRGTDFTTETAVKILDKDGSELAGITSEPAKVSVEATMKKLIMERNARIRPRIMGDLPQGYILGAVTVSPETVRASGPASVMKKYPVLETEIIRLDNLTGEVRIQAKIDVPDGVTVETKTVEVTVPVLNPAAAAAAAEKKD